VTDAYGDRIGDLRLEISDSRRTAAIDGVSGIGGQEDPPEKTRPPEGWPFDKLPSPGHSGQAGQAATKDKKPRPPESKAAATTATTNDKQKQRLALENRGWDGKSNSKTNGTGVKPGDLARFFAG